MDRGFGRKAVIALTRTSRNQLAHWEKRGIVRPSLKLGRGKGSRKEYSFQDLVQLRVAKRLRDEGISLQKVRKALVYLRRNFPEVEAPLAELRFLTNGVDLFVLTNDPKVILDALEGQFVLSLAIGKDIERFKSEIREITQPRHERIVVADRELTIILKPDLVDGGYNVTCKEIPAAVSQGDSEQEALDNIQDAIELCLETEEELRADEAQAR